MYVSYGVLRQSYENNTPLKMCYAMFGEYVFVYYAFLNALVHKSKTTDRRRSSREMDNIENVCMPKFLTYIAIRRDLLFIVVEAPTKTSFQIPSTR